MYIHIHIHIHTDVMSISEKRGHEFERVRKGIREGLERGKGRKKK